MQCEVECVQGEKGRLKLCTQAAVARDAGVCMGEDGRVVRACGAGCVGAVAMRLHYGRALPLFVNTFRSIVYTASF
mgnify:CR=1 FL=1